MTMHFYAKYLNRFFNVVYAWWLIFGLQVLRVETCKFVSERFTEDYIITRYTFIILLYKYIYIINI